MGRPESSRRMTDERSSIDRRSIGDACDRRVHCASWYGRTDTYLLSLPSKSISPSIYGARVPRKARLPERSAFQNAPAFWKARLLQRAGLPERLAFWNAPVFWKARLPERPAFQKAPAFQKGARPGRRAFWNAPAFQKAAPFQKARPGVPWYHLQLCHIFKS